MSPARGANDEEAPRRRRWRRRRRALLGLAVLLALPFLLFGVTSVVTPPATPANPTSVFLLRDALHVGLVLPDRTTSTPRYVEYGFGDWRYYALGRDAWYEIFATVLWPTPGGLSRREWAAASPAELRRSASWVELDELVVDGDAALALRDRLEREFAAKSGQLAHRPRFRMDFVPADRSYWFGNTCADVAAAWLRQLGCTVGWVPIRASLRT